MGPAPVVRTVGDRAAGHAGRRGPWHRPHRGRPRYRGRPLSSPRQPGRRAPAMLLDPDARSSRPPSSNFADCRPAHVILARPNRAARAPSAANVSRRARRLGTRVSE